MENLGITLKDLESIGLTEPEEEVPFITDEPKIPNFICFPSDRAKERFYVDDSFGQGFDKNPKLARVKAIGEFLERLCLFNPQQGEFQISRQEELEKAVNPLLFLCYSEEQVGDMPTLREKVRTAAYRWIKAKDVLSQDQVFIPAQLVFLSDMFKKETEIRREEISTGAAFGRRGTNRAFDSGLLEAIERDACMFSYLTRRGLKKIVNLAEEIGDLVGYLHRYQLEPHIFDVATDLGVPSVMVVTIDKTGIGEAVNVGSKAALNYREAITGALMESIQCRRSTRIFGRFTRRSGPIDDEHIFSLEDRFIYWSNPERINDVSHIINSSEQVHYDELARKNTTVQKILQTFKSRGYHVFVADITLRDIAERGFETLKVMVPELHPLYLDERAKALYSAHYGTIRDDKQLKPHPVT